MLLEDVTVLEVGDGVPVGYAGRVLRSLGATVVKLEAQEALDWVRGYGAQASTPAGLSCAYVHLHGAKHRAQVPKGPPGLDLVRMLAASCDVTLLGDGLLADRVARWVDETDRLPCDVVRIVGTVSGETPVPADESAGVAAGWRDPYGDPQPPAGLRFDVAEMNAGLHAASFAALTLVRPDRRERGPVALEIGVYEAAFSVIEIAAQTLLLAERFEMDVPNIISSPMAEPYACRDGGRIVINVWGRGVWARTCAAIGRPDLEEDPRFQDTYARYAFAGDLHSLLVDWCGTVDRDVAMERLWEQRIPSAPVYDVQEFAAFPQLEARGALPVDAGTGKRVVGSPYMVDGRRPAMPITNAADTQAVMKRLGCQVVRNGAGEWELHAVDIATS